MTPVKPYIALRRLVVVTHNGKIAYDENFHHGVNIIRGRNSSGKSTIANFIFYVLGGDFSNWTTEAAKCRDVFGEVDINGAIITLKRTVGSSGSQPMGIFYGPFDDSRNDAVSWKTFPYRQTDNQISFSHVIFNALEFPEVRTDSDSLITVHQLLRLLYIDQDTSTQNLFRAEKFDPPLTRQTVAEVLLGVYDDSLYKARIELRNAQRTQETKKSEYEAIVKIYNVSGAGSSIQNVDTDIAAAQKKLEGIVAKIDQAKAKRPRTRKDSQLRIEKLQDELQPLKQSIRECKEKITQIELDVFDSEQFIDTLRKRVEDLNKSLLTRKTFGELPLTHCPHCLSLLDQSIENGKCVLCKQPISEGEDKAFAKRLMQEMELQIKESLDLLSEKQIELTGLRSKLPNLLVNGRRLQKELDDAVEESQSTRDEQIDSFLSEKGGIEKEIEFLTQQVKAAEMLQLLKRTLEELAATIARLNLEIRDKQTSQEEKMQTAISAAKKYTLELLRRDLHLQEEFQTGKSVEIDFSHDTYFLDGGNNFSASSKTYFKNSVLYSLLFASLELDFMRYPRFILCDNMEDKGMEKARTQNFQEQIVDLSNNFETQHQIIFTTSMISDKLNENSSLCVGEYYDENNKTLKF